MKNGITASQSALASLTPAAPPEAGLLYWLAGDHEVFSDEAATTPAVNTDSVAVWGNRGSKPNVTATSGTRPTFDNTITPAQIKADGTQFFDDLDFTQPSGNDAFNPFTVAVLTTVVNSNDSVAPAIIGSPQEIGKMQLRFHPTFPRLRFITASYSGFTGGTNLYIARAELGPANNIRIDYRQNAVDFGDANFAFDDTAAMTSLQFLRSTGLSPGGFFNGSMPEFLLYDRWISDAEVATLESYFLRYPYGDGG